ncbi:MAG: tail fiber domain-containing protein [Flavobacteriaceae bacterium]|nr:tail fiber domain-containing protein [Flavobacteriaceae bacterium]
MKTFNVSLFVIFIMIPFFALSQVGIGTVTPNAQLEIKSTNQSTPSNTDGIIIPKIDEFPSTNPTAAQDGMMVYVTGDGTEAKGFYYWDESTTAWIVFSGVKDHDFYKIGTSNPSTSINDDLYTMGKVAIGKNTASYTLDIESNSGERGLNIDLNVLDDDPKYGNYISLNNSGNGIHYAQYNDMSSNGLAHHYGVYTEMSGVGVGAQFATYNLISNIRNNSHYGVYNKLTGTGFGQRYGTHNEIIGTMTGSGIHYGVRNWVDSNSEGYKYGVHSRISGSGSGEHTGSYNLLSGAGTGIQRGFYTNISNTSDAEKYGVHSRVTGDGDGLVYGNFNYLNSYGTGNQYNVYNENVASGSGEHHGVFNAINGLGTGNRYGISNSISTSNVGLAYGIENTVTTYASGEAYGVKNIVGTANSGMIYGTYNFMVGAGDGDNYANYNLVGNGAGAGTGTGDKYANYNKIYDNAGGTHYGLYSEVLKAGNNYAGYFLGKVSIGTTAANSYILPSSRGTLNQVLQTNGSGNLSWVDNTSMGTDNQNISGSSLSGTTLTIGIEGGTNETVDLSTLQDGGAQEINDLNDGKTDATSLFLGTSSGTLDDGTANSNVGVGHNSLGGVTSGYRNTAIGYVSMLSNNTGFANTAIGYYSLGLVTSGYGNVAVGHWAARDAVGSRNTVVGTTAFADNVSGDNNTILGESAARNLTGSNNTMLGRQTGIGSGPYTMNGSVFIGNNVGANESNSYRLYIDNSNTATPLIYGEFDNDILRVNGTLQVGNPSGTGYIFPTNRGAANQVLKTNASGNVSWVNVTSFGSEKIDDLTDGKTNTASNSIYIGVNAGTATSDTNTGNISMGRNTLSLLTTGSNNVAIGDLALEDITSGSSNVALGNYAMTNRTSGSNNVAIGSHSQFFNYTGTENSSLGLRALYGNSGNNNTAIGAHAGHSSGSGSNNVFIGYNSGYNESGNNKLYIENSNANANNALVYGEFDTNIFRINGSFQVSNPVGTGTNHFEVRDTGSTYFGGATYWKQNSTIGTTVAGLFNIGDDGAFTVNNGGNAQHFIYGAGTTAFNVLQLDTDFQISGDNSSNLFYVDASTDRIGIGTATPNTTLHIAEGVDASLATNSGYIVVGDLAGQNMVIDQNEIITRFNGANSTLFLNQTGGDVWAGGALVHSSDRRLKRNIEDLDYGLKEVLQLQPKQYFWKNRDNQKQESLGFIAQDVQGIIENIVHVNDDEQKTLSISYTELIPVLVNAIQEQQKQIESLKTEIISLKESTYSKINK